METWRSQPRLLGKGIKTHVKQLSDATAHHRTRDLHVIHLCISLLYQKMYIWYMHRIVHVYTCYTQSTPLAPQNHESSICLIPQIWPQASKNVGLLCPFLIFYSHPSFVASAIVFKEQHFLPLLISPFFARFQSKASCETSWLLNIWQRMTGFADFFHISEFHL